MCFRTVEGVSFQPRDVPIGPIDVVLGSANVIPGITESLIGMQAWLAVRFADLMGFL